MVKHSSLAPRLLAHHVNILFTDGRINGIRSLRGGRSYNEARAWRDRVMHELVGQGYEIKAFNISQLKVQ